MVKWFANPQPPVEISLEDYAHPERVVGPHAVVYRVTPSVSPDGDDGDVDRLLAAYAPVLVQGVLAADDRSYDPTSDRIGTPELSSTNDGSFRTEVDTSRPVVYTKVASTKAAGRELTQLIYSYWYPRHPVGGIQKGNVDGGIVRVTLDPARKPIVYEHVFPCGCYHGSFVADEVESWAVAEFQVPEHKKHRHTERQVQGRINWVVRDLVIGGHSHHRPIVFSQAGSHLCSAIQTEAVVSGLEAFPAVSYVLRPYAELNRLSVRDQPGRYEPMFNEEGLVWGGRRRGEEIVFHTMDHPGWPRRLEQIKIHWDEAFLMNTTILAAHLRLPTRIGTELSDTLLVRGPQDSLPQNARLLDQALDAR